VCRETRARTYHKYSRKEKNMLQLNANFQYKDATIRAKDCIVEKTIQLSGEQFDMFSKRLLTDWDFIKDNIPSMFFDEDGAYHCLLVTGEGRQDGILVQSEGYNYARYAAHVPHINSIIAAQTQSQSLTDLNQKLIGFTEYLVAELLHNEGVAMHLAGQAKDFDIDMESNDTLCNVVTDMVAARMKEHNLDMEMVEGELTITPRTMAAPVAEQIQEPAGGLKLRDILLLGGMENVYMVHETTDVGFVPASYFEMITDKGRQDHAELLNATVSEIRTGAYGTEIVLSGVEPQLLSDFDQAAADHIQAENEMEFT
jgi:hypothetical protein